MAVKRNRQRIKGRKNEQGLAILMVLICLAILIPFTVSFNHNARVDWQSAVNHADEIKARNINRGAIKLSELLFLLQREVFNQKQFQEFLGAMDITQVAPYLMSIFGSETGAEELGDLIGLDASVLSEQIALQHGGGFEMRLEAESGKINVNCLADTKKTGGKGKKTSPQSRTVETLEALMLPTLYDPLFEEERTDGERYTRQDVLTAIVDYIDEDNKRFNLSTLEASSAPEDYRYTELIDPYQARDSRMDSIDEIYHVRGVDDDWMSAFGSELTTYGACKVNLNFASAEQIALVIQHSVDPRHKWKTEGENFLLMTVPLANFVIETRSFGGLYKDFKEFQNLVKEPDQYINPFLLLGDGDGSDYQDDQIRQYPDGMDIKIKPGKNEDGEEFGGLQDVATIAPERVYRVEIITEVGSVRKRVTGVYDIQATRTQSKGKGAWLYYRDE